VDGVVIVDKPRGITSFDVVARVRRALHERRVGHTGTLDPMATGVLPVCLGEATKLVPFLMAGDKVYQAEARLGVTTDTLDADGVVLAEKDPTGITREAVERALAGFVGTLKQRPPMHSAVRVNGKRLYELAREGVEVEREERTVEVRAAVLEAFEPPTIRFRVDCGKGTYIRSIAGDLGELLGVGAHLTALRRVRTGGFDAAQATPIERIQEAPVLSLADALAGLPTVRLVDDQQTRAVRDGKIKVINELPVPAELCDRAPYARLLRPDGGLVAVAERVGETLRLIRVFSLTMAPDS
jgi:tRNA pseudouridine55 synthase